jgi:glycogen operon protein
VRRFVKGDRATVGPLASRLLGSPDLYSHKNREAEQSVNFVTCHDGFTLNDLVSYDGKHNDANGEDNRDGADQNWSWNCGVEGPTGDPAVEALRNRQVKNFFAIELLAAGTPMLMMGDEVRRTQHGNNNAYCHDSEMSWFDWRLIDRHADLHRFVRLLNEFRQSRDVIAASSALTLNQLLHEARLAWHGVRLDHPDWGDDSHSLAFTLASVRGRFLFHVMLNAYWDRLRFELPPPSPHSRESWRRCIDTALPSPHDISPWSEAPLVTDRHYAVEPRSVVLLTLATPGEQP